MTRNRIARNHNTVYLYTCIIVDTVHIECQGVKVSNQHNT